MSVSRKLQTLGRVLREQGIYGLKAKIEDRWFSLREERKYQAFIRQNRLTDSTGHDLREKISSFKNQPLISVLLPVFNTDEKWLRSCIESVKKQIYPNWELCIADDGSTAMPVGAVLNEFAASDRRIKVVFRETNGHISEASNSALELATGEFTALLDHDDELSEDALFWVANEIIDHPDAQLIYTDEDLIDKSGRHSRPRFKPDWSPDLFLSLNLLNHLVVFRTETLRIVGGFRKGYEGSQDYDVELRVIERVDEATIRHIPRILYHWRSIKGSVALAGREKSYAHERARLAISEHLERIGRPADITEGAYDLHRVRFHLSKVAQKVSLIFTEAVEVRNIQRLIDQTDYPDLDVLIIGQSESSPLPDFRYLYTDSTSIADKLNFGASKAEAELLCFADSGFRALSRDWLRELVGWTIDKDIGVIGAKLLYENWKVMHGGLVSGVKGGVGIAHHGLGREALGNIFRNRFPGNFSAASACFMVIRKELFQDLGGFDADHFPEHLFDADLCLRLRELGKRIVVTPFAELMQAGKYVPQILEKPTKSEAINFAKKWPEYLRSDPFYNPNLSKKSADFSIDI